MPLTNKQELFCQEFLVDRNAARAAIRAGYSKKTAYSVASENLTKPDIRSRIDELDAERATRLKLKQDDVLQRLWDIATADVTELMEFRRECCRYCHGLDHRYQRTQAEMERDRAAHAQRQKDREKEEKVPLPEFDELGGTGWNPKLGPHQSCPECHGDGIGRAFFKDTREMPPHLRALFSGVKQTKDGFEFKIADREKALELVGKHLKMFVDRMEVTGAEGGPVQFEQFLSKIYGEGEKG